MGYLSNLAERHLQWSCRRSLLLDPDYARLSGQTPPGLGISSDVPLFCDLYPRFGYDECTGYLEHLASKLLAHWVCKSCHRGYRTGNGRRACSSDSKDTRHAKPERIGTRQYRPPT